MIFAKNLNMKLVSLLVCCNPCLLDKPWLDVRKGFVEGLPKSHLKLHGMPSTIVSDRDPVFTSLFWKELMRLQGVSLTMPSSYYPQTNG